MTSNSSLRSRRATGALLLLLLFVSKAHAATRELQAKADRAPAKNETETATPGLAVTGSATAGSAGLGSFLKLVWDWIGPQLLSELGSSIASKVKSLLRNTRVNQSCASTVRDAVLLVNEERDKTSAALSRQVTSLQGQVKTLTKYKALVDSLNSQISTLRTQVTTAQRSFNTCKADRGRLRGQVSDLTEQVEELEGQVGELQGQVEELQAQLDECGGSGTTGTGTEDDPCVENGTCEETDPSTDPTDNTAGED